MGVVREKKSFQTAIETQRFFKGDCIQIMVYSSTAFCCDVAIHHHKHSEIFSLQIFDRRRLSIKKLKIFPGKQDIHFCIGFALSSVFS